VVLEPSLDNYGCFLHVLIIIGVNFKLILCAKLFFPKTIIFLSLFFLKRIFYTVLADLAGIWRDLKKKPWPLLLAAPGARGSNHGLLLEA
jgi:hypothetical protein